MHYTHTLFLFFWGKRSWGSTPEGFHFLSGFRSKIRTRRKAVEQRYEESRESEIASVTERSTSWLRGPGSLSVLPFFPWALQMFKTQIVFLASCPYDHSSPVSIRIQYVIITWGTLTKWFLRLNPWRLFESLGVDWLERTTQFVKHYALRNLTLVSEPQAHRFHRLHLPLSHYTNHYWAHWASEQTHQSTQQWHAVSPLPSVWLRTGNGEERKQTGPLSTHTWRGREGHISGWGVPGWPSLPEAKRGKK